MFGGNFDPSQMEQMMSQFGIEMDDIDAEEVVISTEDGKLVFDAAEVTRMDAQGQTVYQVVGEPVEHSDDEETAEVDDGSVDDVEEGVPEGDVELVAQRAGVPKDEARDALEAADGDLAAAVERLD